MKANTNPCHYVYLVWVSTYLYDTFLYNTKVQGYHTSMTLVTLSMNRKSADHLKSNLVHNKVKQIFVVHKSPGGGGGFRLSAHGLVINTIFR